MRNLVWKGSFDDRIAVGRSAVISLGNPNDPADEQSAGSSFDDGQNEPAKCQLGLNRVHRITPAGQRSSRRYAVKYSVQKTSNKSARSNLQRINRDKRDRRRQDAGINDSDLDLSLRSPDTGKRGVHRTKDQAVGDPIEN